ncbi:CRP-like cAMP-binding protein [Kribbella aluminosa]|uniref:CRP-like cAMP-binding protein n=1 Tax=Kribbella aluminosa TaxID=416017 RepID=A0ABS4UJ66_9ACTN|nr:Crp/Fnr family transcriptional regulator [Kribbella aluminosa]MBP2351645.1 CRP-like cAMP-binding protein [Kribbella aluminosa]
MRASERRESGLADQVPYMARLDTPAREQLGALGAEVRYPIRTVVMRQGEPSTYVLLVRDGWFKITESSRNGYEALLRLRGPGDLVGESAVLAGSSRSSTVSAVSDVTAVAIAAEAFAQFLDERPAAMKQLLALINDRLRASDRMRLDFAACKVRERVARLLLELAEFHGQVVQEGVAIVVPLTHQELAGAIGSTREAVTRELRKLREEKVLSTWRRLHLVVRPDVLRRIAG